MPEKRCCACGMVQGNCRERRKLFSEATRHVVPTFISVLSAHLAIPEDRVSGLLPKDSLICKKPCFSSLDSMVTLEMKMRRLKEEIASRLTVSGLYTSAPAVSSLAQPNTSMAATSAPAASALAVSSLAQPNTSMAATSAPAAKRHCFGTPIRSNQSSRRLQFERRRQRTGTSPKATVRLIIVITK